MKRVTAAVLIEEGRVLIARRKEGDFLARKWEFPGGKVEEGETPEEGLKREMREELQIEVNVGEYLGESVYHYEHGSIQLLAYRIYRKAGALLPTVHEEVRWVRLDRLAEYDFSPADVPFVERLIHMGVKDSPPA